jgi:hypothetical protein
MPKKKTKKFDEPVSGAFLDGYLEAALWSSTDESDESGGEPLDKNYSISDVSDDLMRQAIADCNSFVTKNEKLLDQVGHDDSQHGHDFWLTRNGHGAGFWDRNYGKPGDDLSEAAKSFGNFNLYVGDDGKIYGSKG